jgi:DNA-binding LytR/AlgR family response regulator
MRLPVRYMIVEDDELDRLAVRAEADKYSFLGHAATCCHPLEAIELIRQLKPDVLFVDVEMPGMSGIDLVKQLYGKVAISVLITSHQEYALEGYESQVFDYILKPLDAVRFQRCALRIRDYCELKTKASAFDEDSEADTMIIKQGHGKMRISISDILYLEAMKDYTRIVSTKGQFLVLGTLSGLADKLPLGKFVRIHRSYVVNRAKIDSLRGNMVHLPSHELPVGKLYKRAVGGLF